MIPITPIKTLLSFEPVPASESPFLPVTSSANSNDEAFRYTAATVHPLPVQLRNRQRALNIRESEWYCGSHPTLQTKKSPLPPDLPTDLSTSSEPSRNQRGRDLPELGRHSEALAEIQPILPALETTAVEDPKSYEHRYVLANALNQVGRTHRLLGDTKERPLPFRGP